MALARGFVSKQRNSVPFALAHWFLRTSHTPIRMRNESRSRGNSRARHESTMHATANESFHAITDAARDYQLLLLTEFLYSGVPTITLRPSGTFLVCFLFSLRGSFVGSFASSQKHDAVVWLQHQRLNWPNTAASRCGGGTRCNREARGSPRRPPARGPCRGRTRRPSHECPRW